MSWFKNAISNLYDIVSAPVAATRDGLLKRLGDIRGRVTNLYNKVRGRKTLKDIVEEVNYDAIEDVKHMFGREKAEQADGIGDIKHMFGRERKKTRGSMREQRRFKTCLRRVTMTNQS